METLELRSLRDCYDKLIRGIEDPESLADELFSRKLINHASRDEVHQLTRTKEQKNRKLLSAVESSVAIEPDAFEAFVAILKEEPTLQILGDRLQATYGE